MMQYSEKVMEHFKAPHNMGELKDADGVGKIGNPTCGDMMYCFIKVEKNDKGEPILKDIKVKTFGCVAAIATSSMITDLAMGKSLKEAKKITRDSVKDALQGLPPIKVHCSNLAADALHKAIEDYEKKQRKN
jgi:nitrogen fixation NifU-like protein